MNPFTKKLHRGQAHKHVVGNDGEVKAPAKRSTKGHKPGTATSDKQAPHKQRAVKELKHIDQGDLINNWCLGKSKGYK